MMKRRDGVLKKIWFSCLLFIIISPSVSLAAIVGIDSRNGANDQGILGTGSDFDTFRETLTELGHTIVLLSSFDVADLAGLDSIMIKQPYEQAYSDNEIFAIHDFVSNGGGLVVQAEAGSGSNVSNLNDLVSPYGVIYASSPTESSGHTITDLVAHPVTEGVTMIGIDYQRQIISINPPAIDLTIGSGPDDALAVVNGIDGAGNIVFLSDSSFWKDDGIGDRPITFGDNQLVLKNAVQFTIPEPATFSLLCLGSVFLIRRKYRIL